MLTYLNEYESYIATYLVKPYTTNIYKHVVNTLLSYFKLLITVVHADIGIERSESPHLLEGVAGDFEGESYTKQSQQHKNEAVRNVHAL